MEVRPSFWRTVLSGKDNQSFDVGRILWVFFSGALVAHESVAVHHGQPFDAIAFATACGALMAAGGAALGLKSHTEPS